MIITLREKGTLTHVEDAALDEEVMQDDPLSASPEREKGKKRERKKNETKRKRKKRKENCGNQKVRE